MLTEIREIRVQKSTFNIIFLGSHRSHRYTQIILLQATVITKPQWKNSEGVKICENLWETIINPLKSIESNEESKKNRFDCGTLQCHTY